MRDDQIDSDCDLNLPHTICAVTDSAVVHPKHYNSHPSGVECIDIIQWMPYNVGAVVKYCWRAGLKDDAPTIQDYEKAVEYLKFEIARLKGLEDADRSNG